MPHVTERDLDAVACSETSTDRWPPWPWADTRFDGDVDGALEHVQPAARIYRRGRVRIELSGRQAAIFEAVIKPGQVTRDGGVDRGWSGYEGDRRAEGMLANRALHAERAR